MLAFEKIQIYIPSLHEFWDNASRRNREEIKIVGIKKKNIAYFSAYEENELTHIDQIVTDDFTVYDLQLDFETNVLSFYLEHEGEPNQAKILEQVFQTFFIEYNPKLFGFLTVAKRRKRAKGK